MVGGLLVPVCLGGLHAVGRWARQAPQSASRSVRLVTGTIHRVALVLLVVSLVLAPAIVVGELVLDPIG